MVSTEIELFFKENGIKHLYSMPFFPRQKREKNERFSRSLKKKCVQSAIAEYKKLAHKIANILTTILGNNPFHNECQPGLGIIQPTNQNKITRNAAVQSIQ